VQSVQKADLLRRQPLTFIQNSCAKKTHGIESKKQVPMCDLLSTRTEDKYDRLVLHREFGADI
jgi:hypothetical protein